MILRRDLLGAKMLLYRYRIIGSALNGGIVGDHDRLAATNSTDAGDDARGGRIAVVHPVRGQCGELEEGALGIEQPFDAIAYEQLAAFHMAFTCILGTAKTDALDLGAEFCYFRSHGFRVLPELGTVRFDARFYSFHCVSLFGPFALVYAVLRVSAPFPPMTISKLPTLGAGSDMVLN